MNTEICDKKQKRKSIRKKFKDMDLEDKENAPGTSKQPQMESWTKPKSNKYSKLETPNTHMEMDRTYLPDSPDSIVNFSQKSYANVEDLGSTPGAGGSSVLSNIRHGFHSRMTSKKQKIDEYFEDIKNGSKKIEAQTNQLSEERKLQEDTIKSNIAIVIERLEKVIELQSINAEKLDKMMSSFLKSHTQAKEATGEVLNGLQCVLEHFEKGIHEVETKHGILSKKQSDQFKNQFMTLKRKILEDTREEEKRRLSVLGNFV